MIPHTSAAFAAMLIHTFGQPRDAEEEAVLDALLLLWGEVLKIHHLRGTRTADRKIARAVLEELRLLSERCGPLSLVAREAVQGVRRADDKAEVAERSQWLAACLGVATAYRASRGPVPDGPGLVKKTRAKAQGEG